MAVNIGKKIDYLPLTTQKSIPGGLSLTYIRKTVKLFKDNKEKFS